MIQCLRTLPHNVYVVVVLRNGGWHNPLLPTDIRVCARLFWQEGIVEFAARLRDCILEIRLLLAPNINAVVLVLDREVSLRTDERRECRLRLLAAEVALDHFAILGVVGEGLRDSEVLLAAKFRRHLLMLLLELLYLILKLLILQLLLLYLRILQIPLLPQLLELTFKTLNLFLHATLLIFERLLLFLQLFYLSFKVIHVYLHLVLQAYVSTDVGL